MSFLSGLPIERSVLNGLCDVHLLNRLDALQIGDGAGDFEYAVVGTG
jgi:hypothetical protein